MPLEPPPTRITQPFLDKIRDGYRHEDGWLWKDGRRHDLFVDFRDGAWDVGIRGERRITRSTFTTLCNCRPGTEGGFVPSSDHEEQFLAEIELDPGYHWNMIAAPLDKSAFRAIRAAKSMSDSRTR